MRKLLMLLLVIPLGFLPGFAQKSAYKNGEWFKFRVHYGFVTAGYATLEVKDATYRGRPVHHVKGFGETVGVSKWFFKVRDDYQSYIEKSTGLPLHFVRDIDEGGYTKDIRVDFDHRLSKATVKDRKNDKTTVFSIEKNTQDMISAFYYLRNYIDVKTIKEGDVVEMNMFFDDENFKFQLKFLGREKLSTKFGTASTLVFRPYVQSGRVFREKESLTVWISDDENKIPLLIKAELAVGSLKASLIEYKGLSHPFILQK
ncbi:MAG TPA: DUF3108 domain-containing protein [Flavobacteriaceae bacterium]|nr:DUF3108 domain-containing protein [Flavobacteriaceae bacterium]